MEDIKKKQITDKAREYMQLHGLSQNALAEKAGINKAYMSKMLAGVFVFENAGRTPSPISDENFYKLANAAEFLLEYVPHFKNDNYARIMNACSLAQNNHRRVLVDSRESGLSKTYTLEKYAREYEDVLYVKCTSLMKGKDLIQLLLDKLRISFATRASNTEKLEAITSKMLTPGFLIILDEFENVAPDMFRVLKDIEDATYNKCGLVLCGMGITQELENASKRQKKLGPQLWRRFRGNRIKLGGFKKQYVIDGCADCDITDGQVVQYLCDRVLDFAMLAEYVKDIHTYLVNKGEAVNIDNVKYLFKPL